MRVTKQVMESCQLGPLLVLSALVVLMLTVVPANVSSARVPPATAGGSKARNLDLMPFLGAFSPTKVVEKKGGTSSTNEGVPDIYLDAFMKGMHEFIDSLTKDFGKMFVNKVAQGSLGKDDTLGDKIKQPIKALAKGASAAAGTAGAVAATATVAEAIKPKGEKGQPEKADPLANIPIFGQLGNNLKDLGGGLLGGGALGGLFGGAAASAAGSDSGETKESPKETMQNVAGGVLAKGVGTLFNLGGNDKKSSSAGPLAGLFE